jgi:hypothetical protein
VRLPTRTGLLVAVALVVAALPTAAGALPAETTGPTAVTANSATFQDSSGENPAAPDITTIVVSNDDAGMISFRISVPNRAQLGQDMVVDLLVDTDNNPMTGSPEEGGTDYAIQVIRGEIQLYRWDGSQFTRRFGDPSAVTLSFSYQAGITIRISQAELGNTRALKFIALVIGGVTFDSMTNAPDFTNAIADVAPGGGVGLYPFEVRIARPALVVRRLTRTPAAPRAGETFTLRMVAARSDTNAVIQNGRVTCVGRAGNRRLRVELARVQAGAATCTWLIPANVRGRTFRGSVALAFEGLRASRSYSARIR